MKMQEWNKQKKEGKKKKNQWSYDIFGIYDVIFITKLKVNIYMYNCFIIPMMSESKLPYLLKIILQIV